MGKLSNTELNRVAGHAVAKSMRSGTVKPIHHIVMTRIANAMAVESSIAALIAAESK